MNNALFLTKNELDEWGLQLTQDDPSQWMKVWNNFNPENIISRVVDIRWVLGSSKEVLNFLMKNYAMITENAPPVSTDNVETFGDVFRIFCYDSSNPVIAAFKMKMVMYIFVIAKNQIIAKVFIGGSSQLTLSEALKVVKRAYHHIDIAPEK